MVKNRLSPKNFTFPLASLISRCSFLYFCPCTSIQPLEKIQSCNIWHSLTLCLLLVNGITREGVPVLFLFRVFKTRLLFKDFSFHDTNSLSQIVNTCTRLSASVNIDCRIALHRHIKNKFLCSCNVPL